MSSFANLKRSQPKFGSPPVGSSAIAQVPQRLWQAGMLGPLRHVLDSSGKRIRAELVELAFQMSDGKGDLPAGLIDFVELLHGGSLVIDDIEDDSDTRRGKPTLHRVTGTPLAINTGNWMYFSALEKLQDLPLSAEVLNQIMGQSLRTIRRCHEGQALDLAARVSELGRAEVYPTAQAISELKTGGVTALAASLGAAVAGANPTVQNAFHVFGMQLGVGLQMQNDLQELKAGTRQGGRCDDLRNARVTWVWAWASQQLSDREFRELQSLLSEPVGMQRIACSLLAAISESSEAMIRKQIGQALSSLKVLFHPGSSTLLNRLVSRIEQYYV